jgi:predicted dehydrogenase
LIDAYYGARNKSDLRKGGKAHRDFRDLLENEKDLNALYIATPDHWHAPLSMAAMPKRKHVLCQKPMTHSIAEARRVAARGGNRRLRAVPFMVRFSRIVWIHIDPWLDPEKVRPTLGSGSA